jgi:hypothetical protein
VLLLLGLRLGVCLQCIQSLKSLIPTRFLLPVSEFCDGGLEIFFRRTTCWVVTQQFTNQRTRLLETGRTRLRHLWVVDLSLYRFGVNISSDRVRG